MTQPRSSLHFRDATLEDTRIVADLETAIVPDDPRDPEMLAFWWTKHTAGEVSRRWICVEGGAAVAFVNGSHSTWEKGTPRYAHSRARLHPDHWNEESYVETLERAEGWLREQGAEVTVSRVREDLTRELAVLDRLGFREVRRDRQWRLDLVRGRDRLLAAAETTRGEMRRQNVRLLTYDQDADADKARKLYELDLETTADVPKTVPWPVPTFEEWSTMTFDHPGHRADRMWIAREGDAIVGLSFIGYPPTRGNPWTSYTCTARRVRGRGIARALKYETVAQAIELGIDRIGTANDSANAPILHLNEEMGYEPAPSVIELHRKLQR